LTDKIYKSIFKEDANEYRQVLKLNKKESVRSTLYSEILDLIASYENGFADSLKNEFERLKRKLSLSEANRLFDSFEKISNAFLTPLREKARSLMASRDMAFRDALHEKLRNYFIHLSEDEFQSLAYDAYSCIGAEDVATLTGFAYNKESVKARPGDILLLADWDNGDLVYYCIQIVESETPLFREEELEYQEVI
jgi:hypothetical protein